MSQWICNDCHEHFEEPLRIPEYVDDSRIAAFYSAACPYCHSDDIDEFWPEDPEDEDESV